MFNYIILHVLPLFWDVLSKFFFNVLSQEGGQGPGQGPNKDVTGKFFICHVFSRKVYPRRMKVSQNAGKFVWQIIYRTKEKCLAEDIGYVTKKLAE